MKSHLVRRFLSMLIGAMLPVAAEAQVSSTFPDPTQITVWIGTDSAGNFIPEHTKELKGKPTVNLDFATAPAPGTDGACPAELGAPSTARCFVEDGVTFSITKACFSTGNATTCRSAPRPRVSIVDGAIDTMTFTDVLIKNHDATLTRTLHITMHSGQYETAASEPGMRRYAIETTGSFPSSPSPVDGNRVTVQLSPCFTERNVDGNLTFIDCEGFFPNFRLIDNPEFDMNEGEERVSLVFPPYKPAQTIQFNSKEEDGKMCGAFGDVESEPTPCVPWIRLIVGITLAPGQTARIPGSISGAGQEAVCDLTKPETAPACNRWFRFYAGLGPKGAEIYEARLEPSPGAGNSIAVRDVFNSADIWVSRRGEGDDDDDDGKRGGGASVSQTKVKLNSNGTGEVTAHGLCSAVDGCQDEVLPVRVYCGQDSRPAFETLLKVNRKGDGSVELLTTMPCADPAVLILHPTSPPTMPQSGPDTGRWIAAPAIL